MEINNFEYPIPYSISDNKGNSQLIEPWIVDLIRVGAESARRSQNIGDQEIWHLAISTPTIELTASAFLFGWLSYKILHNPISKSPKRITTNDLKTGLIVAGYRRANSTDFPLGREFSGRVTNLQPELNPPRFTVQVNKKESKTIITTYVTDLFELEYEGNKENFLGSWDGINRSLENYSPWEILLGVKKQALGDFIQPSILMNMPIASYQEESELIFDFKIGETDISYPVDSLISRASPGKMHSNFLEVNSTKKDANSKYSDFEIHLMNGNRAVLENIDYSSARMNVSIISRSENSSESVIETITDRRNSGIEIPLLSDIKLKNASLEFLAFGTGR